MLEIITALATEEAHSKSTHSRAKSSPRDAQVTPTQSTAKAQGTANFQGTAEAQGATDIPHSPTDYPPTNESQTSRGDEGFCQKLKKRGKKQKKKVSSVKLGRNKDESNLSEEHHGQDDHNHTAFVYEDFDATDAVVADLERKSDETEERKSDETEERKSDETEERKSDETEQVIIEEEKDTSDVKSGDTEELDLERIQSTARQSAVTPRTLNFDDEAGPSSPIRPTQEEEPEEQFKDDEFLADIPLNISRPRGLSIPGPMQSQPQQPTQTTDPKEKGKGILVEEPKKKKLTLQQIRALETAHDEEVARKVQAEWDAEEERKRLEDLKKPKPKTISKKPTSLAQERTQMMSFLKGQGYKNLQKLRYPQMKELYDKVQESIKDSLKDFIPVGSRKGKADVTGERCKETLKEEKSYNYYKHIPPTGLGLILLGDLTTIWETSATSDDDFWKNQEDWEIIRWRLNESLGVHTLELEDGIMLHSYTKERYPLSREHDVKC
ncbi:hypothetical protein Tco_0327074 [Tanacetum coccineum]